jgi:DNA invertase Pin-like site-specific DNA recombinase
VANIGYARCSTLAQDLTAQRQALAALGVPADRVYLDKGLTGTSRARPGLGQALAAVREGDTLTVTKLDRLARSVPDALDILNHLSARGVRFALGGSVYDWTDPFARMFLQILAVIAEFEANLIRQRTREGMAIARQNGKLRGKQSRLKPAQDREIRRMHDSGDYNVAEIAALFSVSRPTVYRSLDRTAEPPRFPPIPGPCLTSPSTASCSPATSNNSDGPGPSPQEHLVARNSHRIAAAASPYA